MWCFSTNNKENFERWEGDDFKYSRKQFYKVVSYIMESATSFFRKWTADSTFNDGSGMGWLEHHAPVILFYLIEMVAGKLNLIFRKLFISLKTT